MNDPRRDEWFAANRASWDERVPLHVASQFYDVEGFLDGRDMLHDFERAEVGDVTGKTLVHLQCHFGQDTLSWARLGATVTGVDFSAPAIEAARALAQQAGIDAEFLVSNVYDAVEALERRQFDIVYVGMGSLVWLPDTFAWASVVSRLVRPGGFLYLADGHPMSQVLADDTLTVANRYFAQEPERWDEPGTYAVPDAPTVHNVTYEWAHPLGDVITGLAQGGLHVEFLHERDYSFFQRWPFLEFRPEDRTYRMPAGMPSIPMTYSLRASKPA